ncbi:hypothetical protein [Nocardioides sp.]|uniref:hypothetical protein n=1 Tax=Nocardioides sp. TaxID=35761 RepID=UPI00286BD757|nr:hypothetical protein [Nocardioides sp.]
MAAGSERPPGRHRRSLRLVALLAVLVVLAVGGAVALTHQDDDVPLRIGPEAHGGVLSNGCTFSPRGLPTCGAYVGAAYGGNTDPATLEAEAGGPLGVRRTFWRPTQVAAAVATAREDLAAGRLPWISFKLPLSWDEMASGDGDEWVLGIATALSRLPGPVWIAFHHEPEGEGDTEDWRRMQEHLAPIVRAAARNVAFTVILTGFHQLFGDPDWSLEEAWPRDTTVDVAAFDIYTEYGTVKGDRVVSEWPDLGDDWFRPLAAWAREEGVAWGLAETGVTDEAFAREPGLIGENFADLRAEGGIAFSYFDSPLNTPASYQLLDPAKVADFAGVLAQGARLPS